MKNLFLLILLFSAYSFGQKPIFVTAKVKAATVYFNSAELTQTTSVNLPKGTSEIVIKNVSDYLNENSVQVAVPATVTILSVQFTNNYMSEYEIDEKNPAIKKVRDSISITENLLRRNNIQISSINSSVDILEKNQIVGGTVGLNVADLMKLIDLNVSKRTELAIQIDDLNKINEKLNLKLNNLNKKLAINAQQEDRSSNGKLILLVRNEIAGTIDFGINYITSNATWSPFYELRAKNIIDPIDLNYKAKISQSTGIDWKNVKLTLSSGNPNQNNQAPILNSWWLAYKTDDVNYYRGNPYRKDLIGELQGRVAGLQTAPIASEQKIILRGARSVSENNAMVVIDGQISSNEILQNIPPEKINQINVLKSQQAVAIYGDQAANGAIVVTTKQGMDAYTNITENQLNITFDIDLPYDILSNGKSNSVSLKEIKIPATYKYFLAPRVENEAFLMAEISDYSKYNLLQGEANIIFEGLYVGKTNINPTQTTDTLSLSMGKDKKISVKRDKVVDKSGTKFFSSKKEQTFTYDITVRNNKKEQILIMLKDQYPLSPDKEIEIELLQSDNAKINTETGILTWDLNLKPNETKKIRLSYKVKYPKDKIIGNL